MQKQKKYSIKELALMLKPGQLGYSEQLLYLPEYPNGPQVKALLDNSGWGRIRDRDALQAYPTLENLNCLKDYELHFDPTQKLIGWLVKKDSSILSSEKNNILFDYQQEAAYFLALHDRALLALSPGLGKTLTSAYAAGLRGFDNVLVVCPASLLFYWKGELEKWSDKLPRKLFPVISHRHVSGLGGGSLLEENEQFWMITNPETVVRHIKEFFLDDFNCLIVDESIMYKHRDSQRSKAIKQLASKIDVCWLLSGAPATRYLDDMYHQFHILKPKGYSSYWRFARKYCIIHDDEWGSKVVANAPDAEKKIKENFADIYFSRTQDDVLDIPDWIMEDIDIPMHPKQSDAYDTLRKELYIQLDSLDPDEKITVKNHLSLMIRSIQVASNPLLVGGVNSAAKWDVLPELMDIYPGPFLIWCNFIKTGELLRDNLSIQKKKWSFTQDGKLRVVLANGATSMQDRNSMVDAFQKGNIDTLILNNQVGKFGFNLTKARTAFFVERMYDDSYFQCLHRNRRIGTTQSPNIVKLLSVTRDGRKTIDHLVNSVLDYRTNMIRKVTAFELKEVFAA